MANRKIATFAPAARKPLARSVVQFDCGQVSLTMSLAFAAPSGGYAGSDELIYRIAGLA